LGTTIRTSRWDLNNLYPDKTGKVLIDNLDQLKVSLNQLEVESKTTIVTSQDIILLPDLIKQIEKAESYYYCLTLEDTESSFLNLLHTSISALKSQTSTIIYRWKASIRSMTKQQIDDLSELGHLLSDITSEKDNSNITAANLAKEALRGFKDDYTQLRNNIRIDVEGLEGGNEMSFSKANNLSFEYPDLSIRNKIFVALNSSLSSKADEFAAVYNQIIGTRLNLYKLNEEEDYLGESLRMNGVSCKTLETMCEVINTNRSYLAKFLEDRAKEANKDKLSWHELMTSSQGVTAKKSYSKAVSEIAEALGVIDKDISEFINNTIINRWVDSEPRDSKAPGGFCVPFISEGESRISINYVDTMESARILAHELGHAWHFKLMKSNPSLRFLEDKLSMTIAETASIFFEMTYIDFVIHETENHYLKKSLLRWKIERSLNYLISIVSAFRFENIFYNKRRHGPLTARQIEEISLQSQEEAFGAMLSEYQPFVWIKYSQFYSDVPFYNYPYTFGYLLSIGLLEVSKSTNGQFSRAFQNFLSQTGDLPVEQLVKKHFNIDLSNPDFWQQSLGRIHQDIEEYLAILN
jgi:oligoendopeptidase F